MPNDLQEVRLGHPTDTHDFLGRCRLDRLPGVQLYDGHPRLNLCVRPVRHRTHQRENRYRRKVHKI